MIGHRLNSEVTIYQAAWTSDGAGGQTAAPWEVLGTARAQVSQPTAEERLTAARGGANLTHVIHVPYGTEVYRGNELDIGDELDLGSGRRLRVVAVLTNSRRTYKRLECEAIQGD